MSNALAPLICQIDHIAASAHGLFGYGWALDRAGAIVRSSLHLRFSNGLVGIVKVSTGRARVDVASAYPDHPQAAHAGLMFMAGWSDEPPVAAELVFEMEDGRLERAPLNVPTSEAGPRTPEHRSLLARIAQKMAQPIAAALRGGRSVHAGAFDHTALTARLRGRRCRLLIDHSMGGGANMFRRRLVSEWIAAGDTVILLSFRVAAMTAFVEVHDHSDTFTQTLDRVDELVDVVAAAQLIEVFFNCAVSFTQAQQIQKLLLDLRRRLHVPLVVAVHEYFLVCPSAFLLDRAGSYCGVPSIDQCAACLREHEDGFASLTGERSIVRWREMWGEVLGAADEIRCFSESTRRLLERAYPGVAARATLRPHEVEPLRVVDIRRSYRSTLTIGVFGTISHHKGADIVAGLANTISETGANVRIVVIGSVETPCSPAVVLQTGSYRRDDLPELVEQHGIDIALLPSICPETFSFVAHEVISMQLPIMCLDLGAQADLVRGLVTGWVSPCRDGPGLLEQIMAFDRYLYPSRFEALP